MSSAEELVEAGLASQQAVFLHSGWRCGSTYIWNKFRNCAGTLCFYEPFHEVLSRCTVRKIWRDGTHSWDSRHPPLSLPYRHEYLPVLRRGGLRGVRGYREEFALADYFPSHRGITPQVDYLHGLMRHARGLQTRPVFGFSRSLARADAIKRAMGGWHVLIRRDPVQQWLSCRSYRIRESAVYFEVCHFLILALAAAESPAGRYARQLGLPRPPAGCVRDQFEFMQHALWPWDDDLSYRACIGVLRLSEAAAMSAADLILDIDRLSREPQYRACVRGAIFAETGLAAHFDDCRVGTHSTAGIAVDFASADRDILLSLRACGANIAAEHEPSRRVSLRAAHG